MQRPRFGTDSVGWGTQPDVYMAQVACLDGVSVLVRAKHLNLIAYNTTEHLSVEVFKHTFRRPRFEMHHGPRLWKGV